MKNLGTTTKYFYHIVIDVQSTYFPVYHTRSGRKLSTNAQLAQSKEGKIDLETPDSILCGVNLRSVLNSNTFSTLARQQQERIIQLMPSVDSHGQHR